MLVDNFKLSGQGSGIAKNVAEAVVREITNERHQKGVNLQKNSDMYGGEYAKYFKPRKDEDQSILQYRKDNPIECNHVEFTVNLSARYLYGRASKVVRIYSK